MEKNYEKLLSDAHYQNKVLSDKLLITTNQYNNLLKQYTDVLRMIKESEHIHPAIKKLHTELKEINLEDFETTRKILVNYRKSERISIFDLAFETGVAFYTLRNFLSGKNIRSSTYTRLKSWIENNKEARGLY